MTTAEQVPAVRIRREMALSRGALLPCLLTLMTTAAMAQPGREHRYVTASSSTSRGPGAREGHPTLKLMLPLVPSERLGVGAGMNLDIIGIALFGRLDLLLVRVNKQAYNYAAIF